MSKLERGATLFLSAFDGAHRGRVCQQHPVSLSRTVKARTLPDTCCLDLCDMVTVSHRCFLIQEGMRQYQEPYIASNSCIAAPQARVQLPTHCGHAYRRSALGSSRPVTPFFFSRLQPLCLNLSSESNHLSRLPARQYE
jgi:hypothetical protein